MYVKNLTLKNFRNYDFLDINFIKGTNILLGDNAQGKTNILEALYYASIGKSHRTNKDKELIKWNSEDAYLKVNVGKTRRDKKIEIKIFKEGKKGININSIKINKLSELIGTLNVVMFSPEDLNIVKDSPSYRRKFLDIELCKLDSKYYYNLSSYKKILSERNILLKKSKINSNIFSMIDIYDNQLSEFGEYVIKKRLQYIQKLNIKGKSIHKDITSSKENVEFKYLMHLKGDEIKKEFYEELVKNREKDLERRTTTIGPHRDDFTILINGADVKTYGSQGQQRTVVLSMKFASLHIIKDLTGEYPLLLLDDVLSELDLTRQKYILNSINDVQTLITCTGINNIKKYLNDENTLKVFKVSNGKIIKG